MHEQCLNNNLIGKVPRSEWEVLLIVSVRSRNAPLVRIAIRPGLAWSAEWEITAVQGKVVVGSHKMYGRTVINGYFSEVRGKMKSCWVYFSFSSCSLVLSVSSGPELGQRRWLWQRGQRTGAEGLRLSSLLHHQYVPHPLLPFSPVQCRFIQARAVRVHAQLLKNMCGWIS